MLWAEAAEDGAAEDTPEDESDLDRDSRRSDREALVSRREPTSRSLARSWKEMVISYLILSFLREMFP